MEQILGNDDVKLTIFLFLLSSIALGAESPPVSDAIADAHFNNQFALEIYKELGSAHTNSKGNLFLSPMSIRTAMALAYAGSKKSTSEEISKAFHFGSDQKKLSEAIKKELAILSITDANKDSHQLLVSQSLWFQKGLRFSPEYTAIIEELYSSNLKQVDFKNAESARKEINEWVKDQTEEKITDLVPKNGVDPFSKLILASAIYFKGKWSDSFENQNTKPTDFYISKKSKVRVPMMNQRNPLLFGEDKNLMMLKLGYVDSIGSFVILLPKKKDGLSALEKNISTEMIINLLKHLATRNVDLTLPKYEFSSNFNLKSTLKALGVKLAFDPLLADFSGMTLKKEIFLTDAFHKAWFCIDEQGTEAAAASAFAGAEAGFPPKLTNPVEFRADHPFMFFIMDDFTGSIMFIGKLTNPT